MFEDFVTVNAKNVAKSAKMEHFSAKFNLQIAKYPHPSVNIYQKTAFLHRPSGNLQTFEDSGRFDH